MKSGRFDCEIFQKADDNTAIDTILNGLEFVSDAKNNSYTWAFKAA